MAKDKDYIQMIHTNRWLSLRKHILSVHPLCECCRAEGRIEAATEVHHVRPVEEAINYIGKRERMYDPSNLQALCHSCHVKIHTAMGRAGKAATKKRNEDQARQVIEKFFGRGDDAKPGADFLRGGTPR